MQALLQQLKNNPTVLLVGTIVSLVLFVDTLIAVPIVCVRMPADAFTKPLDKARGRHPLRAALGWVIIVMGVVMLVLPGQGLITIAIGLSLLDFPKKRVWQRRILRHPDVMSVMNAIRSRAGKPPFES